ncbi:MAG TPA: mismatch-specific DNA-glycosylase [Rhizomicrobium sp.]|nr:mismatch-specific DNA-glycosylase [Rhizomicrobium sp.]
MRDDAHILPDRLKPGLKLVFCGTAAGRQSALQKAYYAHKQNKFWRTLFEVGLTPHLFEPKGYPGLWKLGIGLTDIAKYSYGMDHQLPKNSLGHDAAEALRARILQIAPRYLAFTSLTAGRAVMGKDAPVGEQQDCLGVTRVWILPSPSPLASNHWDIAPWRALARQIKKSHGA